MLPKPTRGIRLNKSHPLARGLVGYWLLNEGSGNKVFDLSGNGNNLSFFNSPVWSPGKFGSAILFDDASSQYLKISQAVLSAPPITMACWFNSDTLSVLQTLIAISDLSGWSQFKLRLSKFGINPVQAIAVSSSGAGDTAATTTGYSANTWHHACAVFASSTDRRAFIDGGSKGTDTNSRTPSSLDNTTLGCQDYHSDGPSQFMSGKISCAFIWNRALSDVEVALLYREPFCMFDRAWNVARLSSLVAPQIVELGGTSTALSSLSTIAKVSRKVGGTIAGTSNVDGSLGIIGGQIVELAGTIAGRSNVNGYLSLLAWTTGSWLTEALFNGMTANAFKLGTSLSLGWFWVRVTGCSALYRGQSGAGMGEVDFTNILTVSNLDVSEISPPSYIPHNSGSTYFYVVRRFNNCGYQEHTLAAAVKVSMGSSGELAEPQPNSIFSSKVEQVDSNKIWLTWFYCPLEQGSRPVGFNVYYDDQTGQIDFENPLAIISYKGRKFYSFQSPDLSEEAGEHLFAIRAEDAGGIENISLARLKIQLDTLNPDVIDILSAEAV